MSEERFFLQNTGAGLVSHFDETWEVNQWYIEVGATTTTSLYTSDTDHPSCMSVTSDTDGKGVYYTVESVDASTTHILEFSYKNGAGQEIDIVIYDNSNGANIDTDTVTATSWSNYYNSFTTPAGCTEVIIYLRAGTAAGTAFYIDDIYCNGNALAVDPDTYSPAYSSIEHEHTMQDGSKTVDRTDEFFRGTLDFKTITHAMGQRLLEFKKADEPGYFDDQVVPAMVERGFIYTAGSYTYSGVTNPSGTHVAYYDTDASEQANQNDFQSNEFSTANYQAVDGDDSNYTETTASTNYTYVYHKFTFAHAYTAASQVKSFTITYKGAGIDLSDSAAHGLKLFLWNGNSWFEVDESITSDKTTLTFTTTHAEIAQEFVDIGDSLIFAMVRTRAKKSSTGSLTLRSYYIECDVNEDLSGTISLKNKAILSSGDVVHVKNLTYANTEQVTNGKFTSATTSWTASGANLSSVAGGQNGNCLQIESTGAAYGWARQTLTVTNGRDYTFNGYYKSDGVIYVAVYISTSLGGGEIYVSGGKGDTGWTKLTKSFTATASTIYIELILLSNAGSQTGHFDEVSVTADPTLVLATEYTVGDDRQSIVTSGQTAGDLIEVKYNQYYKVKCSNSISELRQHTGSATSPHRETFTLNLEAVTGLDD